MLASLKQILAQYFVPFFRFWIGVSHEWIGFDGIYCQLIFLDLIWPTPSFSFLSIYQKNQCSQSSVWQHNLTSPFFFLSLFCLSSQTNVRRLPLFFIILVCLHWIDVLRHNLTTSLFYHSLSNHQKVKVLWHILTLPLFFNFFFLDFKITFSLTFFGVFPYFLQFLSVLMLTISLLF